MGEKDDDGSTMSDTPHTDLLDAALAGEGFLLLDGAMGTQLQERGLAAGELPELLCLTHPEQVTQIHAA